MPFEKYSGYITPAFPAGHRTAIKGMEQIENERARRVESTQVEIVAQSLRALTNFEGWDVYSSQLGIIEKQLMEEMVQSVGPNDHIQYLRGYIMGLRKAVHLPAELAQRSHTQ